MFRDFYYFEFVFMFLDEVDESCLNDVKVKCGFNFLVFCIFDYLVMGDIEVVLLFGKLEEILDKNIVELGN